MTYEEQAQQLILVAMAAGVDVERERAAYETYCSVKNDNNWNVWLGRAVAGACRLV